MSLLIAIPVAIIGSISLAARRGIIVKNPVGARTNCRCRTAIFDKTGTLTYGEPKLTEQLVAPGFRAKGGSRAGRQPRTLLEASAGPSHPRAGKEEGLQLQQASQVSEPPGQGLRGTVCRSPVQITSRGKLIFPEYSRR